MTEVLPDIHQFRLPLTGSRLRHINAYLLRGEDGYARLLGPFFARNSGIGPRCSVRLAKTITSRSSSWSWSISEKVRRFGAAIVRSPGLSRL
jgi:hypothetical protein